MFYEYFHAHICNWLHKMCCSSAGSCRHLPCPSFQSLLLVVEPRVTSLDRATTRPMSWFSGFKWNSIQGTSLAIDCKWCAAALLALLSHLPGVSCQAPLPTSSRGVALLIEPLHARGGGVVALLEPSTLGYQLVRHGWTIFVGVFVSQNCLKTAL